MFGPPIAQFFGWALPRSICIFVACCVVFKANSALGQTWNDAAVLLKTDRVLVGQVELRADLYVIKIAEGSQVSLPRSQVRYVGKSIEDLYQFKLRGVVESSVGDHFKLSQWCLANGMLGEAATHYIEVSKTAGDYPQVKRLAIQLKEAMLQQPGFREHLGLGDLPPRPASAETVQSNPADPGSSQVISVNAETGVSGNAVVAAQFAQRIQPILRNRCSQSHCHGAASSNNLRLLDVHGTNAANMTQQNLQSILKYTDGSDASQTPLVRFATNAHGLQRSPGIRAVESELSQELLAWVRLVQNPVVSAEAHRASGAQTAAVQMTGYETQPLAPQDHILNPVQGETGLRQVPRPGPSLEVPSEFPVGLPVPSMEELDALENLLNQQLGKATTNLPSADPFDPAEFNRRRSGAANQTVSRP